MIASWTASNKYDDAKSSGSVSTASRSCFLPGCSSSAGDLGLGFAGVESCRIFDLVAYAVCTEASVLKRSTRSERFAFKFLQKTTGWARKKLKKSIIPPGSFCDFRNSFISSGRSTLSACWTTERFSESTALISAPRLRSLKSTGSK